MQSKFFQLFTLCFIGFPSDCSAEGNEVIVEQNKQAILRCQGVPPSSTANITWTKNNKTLAHDVFDRFLFKDRALVFRYVTMEDAGAYSCWAIDRKRGLEFLGDVTLEVGYTPQATFLEPFSHSHVGEKITFPCFVIGSPTPKVTWYKNRRELPRDSRMVGGNDETPSLTIRSSQTSDRGVYQCKASNKYGDAMAPPIKAVISDKPTMRTRENNLTVQAGESQMLECEILLSQTVVWYRNYIPIDLKQSGKYVQSNVSWSANTSTLLIRNVNPRDGGKYICQGRNEYGTAESRPVTVLVKSPVHNLRITLDNKIDLAPLSAARSQTLHSSLALMVCTQRPLHLYCRAEGSPHPRYRWSLGVKTLIENSDGLLTVTNIRPWVTLFLTCLAWNPHGSVQADVTVVVSEKCRS